MVSLTMVGGAEVAKHLNALGDELKGKVLVDALTHAAEPMRATMASHALRGDEAPHVADNIGISPVRRVEGVALHEDEAAVAVGPTKGFYYSFFLEYGTSRQGAHPFVRPGFDANTEQAVSSLVVDIGAALMRAADKP